MGKGIEHLRDKGFVHADTRVLHLEFQGALVFELGHLGNGKGDAPGGFGKLDGVAQDVDEYLLELHVVADKVVIHMALDMAFEFEALVRTLGHDHGVDLFQHSGKGELLLAHHQPAGFDSAHVQNVVDEPQQVPCTPANLFQVLAGPLRNGRVSQG